VPALELGDFQDFADVFDDDSYLRQLAGCQGQYRLTASLPLNAGPAGPQGLFLRGVEALLATPTVALVGSRSTSASGQEITRRLATELTTAGVTIASGLSRGTDKEALEAVLEAHGQPIGVLGCGIDVDYPSVVSELIAAVAASGLVLSENGLGANPLPWRFERQAQLLAGLADVVVVIEAHLDNSAMSVATCARALGKPIATICWPEDDERAQTQGPRRLLAAGAAPVASTADILSLLPA
jgi:DNA processing protein